jgi:glycosyltransferase involved in cell wall biosynthesis
MSVGVIVRDEEKNILNLFESISGQRPEGLTVDEIVVVSSGFEDRTNKLVARALGYGISTSRKDTIVLGESHRQRNS